MGNESYVCIHCVSDFGVEVNIRSASASRMIVHLTISPRNNPANNFSNLMIHNKVIRFRWEPEREISTGISNRGCNRSNRGCNRWQIVDGVITKGMLHLHPMTVYKGLMQKSNIEKTK